VKRKSSQIRETQTEYKTHRVMEYSVIIHHSKYGYDVECPVLPGCCSQGDTFKEAIENIEDAIKTYIEMVDEEIEKSVKKSRNYTCCEVRVGV